MILFCITRYYISSLFYNIRFQNNMEIIPFTIIWIYFAEIYEFNNVSKCIMFLPEWITFLNDWVMVLTHCTCITLQIVWFVFLPNSCFLLNWLYSYQPGSGNIVLKCIKHSCINFVMIFFLSCLILFSIYVDRLVIISSVFYCISLISKIRYSIQYKKTKKEDIFHLNHYLYLLIQIVLNIFWIN